jgi:hypothetical protein
MSATSAPPTTAPRSSASKAKAARNAGCPSSQLLSVIETYLGNRAVRFPDAMKHKAAGAGSGLSQWPANAPLFVGRDGDRITRGPLQSRIKRAFKRAGPDAQPVSGALVHGLRLLVVAALIGVGALALSLFIGCCLSWFPAGLFGFLIDVVP